MKRRFNKIIIGVALLMSILYFTSDFALIDIEKTAIIVALGIDKTKNNIEITAQIGMPQSTADSLNNDDTLISATGETVMDAIENLAKRSGWFPKLSFCKVIILGKDLAYDNIQTVINHLLSSEYFQNSALLAISDGSAREFLSTPTPLDNISSFAIQKVLVENGGAPARVLSTNIKNYCILSSGRSTCSYMPYIRIIQGEAESQKAQSAAKIIDNRPIEGLFENKKVDLSDDAFTFSFSSDKAKIGDNGLIGGLFRESSNSSSDSQKSPTAIFDATQTAVIKDGKIVDILSEEETAAFNFLKQPVKRVMLSVKKDGSKYTLEIYNTKYKKNLSFDKRANLNLSIKLTVRIADSNYTEHFFDEAGRRASVEGDILVLLEQKLTKTLSDLAERLLKKDCDLFGIRDMIYRYHNLKYADYQKIPLSQFNVNIDITAKSLDTSSDPT